MKQILLIMTMVTLMYGQDNSSWIPKNIYKTPDSLMTDSDYIKIQNWGDIAMVMVVDSTLIVNNDTSGARCNMVISCWDLLNKATDDLDLWVTFNFPNRYDGVRYFSREIVHWIVEFTPAGYCKFKMWGRREPSKNTLSE